MAWIKVRVTDDGDTVRRQLPHPEGRRRPAHDPSDQDSQVSS